MFSRKHIIIISAVLGIALINLVSAFSFSDTLYVSALAQSDAVQAIPEPEEIESIGKILIQVVIGILALVKILFPKKGATKK